MRKFVLPLAVLICTASPVFGQSFGSAVAVAGDEVVVGDVVNGIAPGSVYIFRQADDGSWMESARVSASDSGGEVDAFGTAVAADGDVMVVGAPRVDAAYVFVRDTYGTWNEAAKLTGPGASFGAAVAIEGDVILVGAPGSRRDDGEAPASASVFKRTAAGDWVHGGELIPDSLDVTDAYGGVLALAAGRALIGAPGTNDNAGAVYSFAWNDELAAWAGDGAIETRYDEASNRFGASLVLADGHLAVGMPGFDERAGSVVVFKIDPESGKWRYSERLSPFSSVGGEAFGTSMAIAGSQLWVGAPRHGGRGGAGAIFQFDLNPESASITGSSIMGFEGLQRSSQLGGAMAALGNVAVVGAPGYDNRAGVAFAMANGSDGWVQSAPLINESVGYESIAGELIQCEGEVAGEFPCKDVNMTSFVSVKDLGADRGVRTNDLWGWEDPETGHEYAIVGLSNQTSFVDVTDAYNPVFLGKLPMPPTANMSVWRDMKVYKDHAFIVSDGAGEHGMQVFDLRNLRDVPNPPVVFEETTHYEGIFSAHNIVINEETGFAYSVGSSAGGETCGGGLHMIDVRDPANPTFAGCFADGETGRRGTGYSHDAQCVTYIGPDADYTGREICIGANETAISIADVTDKDNPISVSIASYPNAAYTHQGWLTEDHRYFYLNDEIDEARNLVEGTRTLIFDLADLEDPVLAGEYIAETTETDHNLYVKGDLMYQSNTAAGLRILDVSDPESPREVAYFDTSPVGGRGVSWSNYPFFKSGAIIVTGGHHGLFVLRKKEVDI